MANDFIVVISVYTLLIIGGKIYKFVFKKSKFHTYTPTIVMKSKVKRNRNDWYKSNYFGKIIDKTSRDRPIIMFTLFMVLTMIELYVVYGYLI